jgi:hypothetical protein
MKIRQWITALVLILLIAAGAAAWWWTRAVAVASEDAAASAPVKKAEAGKMPSARRLVDLRPLQTARRMAAMASTPEEMALAH